MTKIRTVHNFKFGQTNVLPFLGATQISSEGVVEVEDDNIAKQLVDLAIGWEFVDEGVSTTTTTTEIPTTTTTTVDVIEKVEVDSLNKSVSTTGTSEEVTTTTTLDLLSTIDSLTVAELQKMANPFPKTEWSSLNKASLQEYLKQKLA